MAPEHFILAAFQHWSTICHCPQFSKVITVHRVVYLRVTELFATGLTRATSMAKSDPDSNDLWQDQPEFPDKLSGLTNTLKVSSIFDTEELIGIHRNCL
jgi:hypothetical protein